MHTSCQLWSLDEEKRLKTLHLSPYRHSPAKLAALVKYFQNRGSAFGALDKGLCDLCEEDKTLAPRTATKIRKLVQHHQLDWVLNRQIEPEPKYLIRHYLDATGPVWELCRIEADDSGTGKSVHERYLAPHEVQELRREAHQKGKSLAIITDGAQFEAAGFPSVELPPSYFDTH